MPCRGAECLFSQDAAAGHPWFRPAAPRRSPSFLPPFVSPIRTTHPSCSWPSWRAGTTVKMPRGYSITWGPRNWWVGRLSLWPWHCLASELHLWQSRASASSSFLYDATDQKCGENVWFGPLPRAGKWALRGGSDLCLQHKHAWKPPWPVSLGGGGTGAGLGAWRTGIHVRRSALFWVALGGPWTLWAALPSSL